MIQQIGLVVIYVVLLLRGCRISRDLPQSKQGLAGRQGRLYDRCRVETRHECRLINSYIPKAMNQPYAKTICDRCGEKVFRRNLHVENLTKYDTSSKDSYISSLMALESVSIDVATSWAEHGLYESCKELIRNCPACGEQLKTWKTKLCLSCGATFEPWCASKGI